jgi:hypothetical protein
MMNEAEGDTKSFGEQRRDTSFKVSAVEKEADICEDNPDLPPSKRRLVRTACLPCRKRKSKVFIEDYSRD